MIVAYNDNNPSDPNALGPSLFYSQNSDMLRDTEPEGMVIKPHDFRSLLLGKEKFPRLGKDDVVFSNVGPYAWFYHHMRRKLGRKFRIVRDVRTALHSDFIFQETMCTNMMEEGDAVIFPSEYSRRLFMKMFPEKLNAGNTFICYPSLTRNFPRRKGAPCKEDDEGGIVLGWIGRVFATKNFGQALEIFVKLHGSLKGRKVRMLVGGTADPEFGPGKVKRYLSKKGVDPGSYVHVRNGSRISYEDIWPLLMRMDVFLFPSVGNVESLGRTIMESSHMGVPVIAGDHGASPELIDRKNLVDVEYSGGTFDANKCVSMGSISIDDAVEKCGNLKGLSRKNNNRRYEGHHEKLLRILRDEHVRDDGIELSSGVRRFIGNVRVFLSAGFGKGPDELVRDSVRLLTGHARRGHIRVTSPIGEIQQEVGFRLFSRVV